MRSFSRAPTLVSVALCAQIFTLACGGGGDSEGGSRVAESLTRVDACSLLTPAEVGDAIGVPVAEPTRREADGGYAPEGVPRSLVTICIYDGGWPNAVNLTVRQSGSWGPPTTSAALAARLNEDLDDADPDTAGLIEGGRWSALSLDGHAAALRDAGEGGWTATVEKDAQDAVVVLLNGPTREAVATLAGIVMSRLQ